MVVAKPGHFRDSLVALLRTLPQVVVELKDDNLFGCPSAERPLDGYPSTVVLVEGDAFGRSSVGQSIAHSLELIKANWPKSRYVVMVDNVGQMDRMRAYDAANSGVDYILSKSASVGEFLSAVGNTTTPDHHILADREHLHANDHPVETAYAAL
jgi:hypothetical protein